MININLTSSQIDESPGQYLPYLIQTIKQQRWFAEKDYKIKQITVHDTFKLESSKNYKIQGIIARFKLKKSGNFIIKQYFIPVMLCLNKIENIPEKDTIILNLIDGKKYIYFAEYLSEFQQALINQFQKSNFKKAGYIPTNSGGFICFHNLGDQLKNINQIKTKSPEIQFSSSNVLTFISSSSVSMVCKTYKDIRGYCSQDKIWLPNPEIQRYKALAYSGYANIPEIYGFVVYKSSEKHETPLHLFMEAVSGQEIGNVFSAALDQLFSDLQIIKTKHINPDQYVKLKKSKKLCSFASDLAKTIAQMHTAFINYSQKQFAPIAANYTDICQWIDKIANDFYQALENLNKHIKKHDNSDILKKMVSMLEKNTNIKDKFLIQIIKSLTSFDNNIVKAQVHGDLHAGQGLFAESQIKWLDFEGPPAKECVCYDYDSRENLLIDLAGMIQAFWYIINIKTYNYLQLNHENFNDHETQQKISMVLAQQSKVKISGLDNKLVHILNLWYTNITNAFIKGYLDEIEAQNIQNAILKKWDRKTAKSLIYYWVLARALHELRYETYARNWGWEAIPGARILQLLQIMT